MASTAYKGNLFQQFRKTNNNNNNNKDKMISHYRVLKG